MPRRFITLIIALAVTCTLDAANAAGPPAGSSARAGKVGQTLDAIGKARAISDISRILKAANLSQKELELLADQIEKGPLLRKIEALRDQALASSKLEQTRKGPDATQLLKQKRLALEKARAESISLSNMSVLRLKPARSTNPAAATAPPPRETMSVAKVAGLTRPGGNTSSARINDCSAPVVGEQITIRGTGFGQDEGRVAIILRRDIYYCPVTTWTATRIVCTVADDLELAVGDAMDGVEAVLWVKLNGGETGPAIDTRILPNPERLDPVIESITPDEISPGQSFIIRGRNLVKYRYDRAKVRLLFGNDSSVEAIVEDPDHEFIQAKIPDDYGGVQRTVCRLEVTNDLRRSTEQTVTFVPAEEIMEIRTPGRISAACQPPFPGFLCLIGDTSTGTVHDIVLMNGWVVEDCVLDIEAHGINAGAHYLERPDRGAVRARAVVEAWADAYSRVVAVETLFIKGPRGVPYR